MAKVVAAMAVSLDGFVHDRAGDTSRLYPDRAALREMKVIQDAMQATGAVVMGRRTYDMAQGDFTDYEFQVPLFVVTHHAPENVAKGENEHLRFCFVTDGVESAIARAKDAAGSKDITVVGGPELIRQLMHHGLIDEFSIGIVPVLLGGGLRLFDAAGDAQVALEQTAVIESPVRTDLKLRVVAVATPGVAVP